MCSLGGWSMQTEEVGTEARLPVLLIGMKSECLNAVASRSGPSRQSVDLSGCSAAIPKSYVFAFD